MDTKGENSMTNSLIHVLDVRVRRLGHSAARITGTTISGEGGSRDFVIEAGKGLDPGEACEALLACAAEILRQMGEHEASKIVQEAKSSVLSELSFPF